MKSLFDLLFKQHTDNIFLQFFRYQFVGGLAFLVDFFLLFFFTSYCGIYYLLSGILSFIISVIVNYVLSVVWVFNPDKSKNHIVEFNSFLVISVIGLGFTELLLFIFTDYLSLYYLYSKILSAVIVMFWNFGARRVFLYRLN